MFARHTATLSRAAFASTPRVCPTAERLLVLPSTIIVRGLERRIATPCALGPAQDELASVLSPPLEADVSAPIEDLPDVVTTGMSDEAKKKIARAQRRRWKDPELRHRVKEKLKGRTPWNKGRSLSEEHKAKIAAARTGRPVSQKVRTKLSKLKAGKTLAPEARRKVSAALAGKPKSTAHREAIAAAQRKRHAAARVLKAIELHYREEYDSVPAWGRGRPSNAKVMAAAVGPSASLVDASGAVAGPRGGVMTMAVGGGGRGGGGGGVGPVRRGGAAKKQDRPTVSAVVDEYTGMLREYRALQEELKPWTSAFVTQHGRKPRLADVEHTGIQWLIARYKKYLVIREHVLSSTPSLRNRIGSARPTDAEAQASINNINAARPAAGAGASRGVPNITGGSGMSTVPTNINSVPSSASSAAAAKLRMTAALKYRAGAAKNGAQLTGSIDEGPSTASEAAAAAAARPTPPAASDTAAPWESVASHDEDDDADSPLRQVEKTLRDMAAAEERAQSPEGGAGSAPAAVRPGDGLEAARAKLMAGQEAKGPGARRANKALQAAMEYRKQRASEVASRAAAAAAQAAKPKEAQSARVGT
ncbi:unnamed protein product [Pedinophyceae sp. YPF-701]|nr:unnamed protein product [Pedinophyceae sp. YPF-701]